MVVHPFVSVLYSSLIEYFHVQRFVKKYIILKDKLNTVSGDAMASHLNNSSSSEQLKPSAPNSPKSTKKESVLDKAWFISLMCIFVAPFGLILLIWRKRPHNHSARVALIVVMAIWTIFWFAGVTNPKSSQTSTTTDGSAQQTSSATTESETASTPEPTITGISATYSGSTEEGTVLNTSNAGIQVAATYSDGSTKEVSDYTIAEPATLTAGQTSTVTITSGDESCQLSVACTTLTADQYKAQCTGMSFEDLARNPDSVKGSYVSVTGQVIQVQQDSSDLVLRVSITKDSYGIWSDPIIVAYTLPAGADNILEKDIVTIYGQSVGDYTYTTVLGASETVPAISAKYIDVSNS